MNKFIWSIDKIEKRFEVALKRNATVLGIDTASKTGYCIAKTDEKKLILEIGFVAIDVSKIKDKDIRHEMLYASIYDTFNSLIASRFDTVIIENVFHSFNPDTTILLSRLGAIIYTICKVKGIKDIMWKSASQARKALGINQKCEKGKGKETIVKRINKRLNTNITCNDEIDAIVLAMNGLLQ